MKIPAIYKEKPMKVSLKKGTLYSLCPCGYSEKFPFCDGTHKTEPKAEGIRSYKFEAPEDGDYWLCFDESLGQ